MNITDQHNRVHDYLRISLTERCNLRCFYCMPAEGIALRPKSAFMTSDEILQIANTFVSMGVNKIRLTGGEPLVRSDAKEIISRLSKLPIELAITTNGILLEEYIDTLKGCNVKSINVSLDSLVSERFNNITRRDYFSKVLSNIHLLLENDFHVKINVVLIKGVNDDEICDFIDWTRDKNVHVRFIEFMPFDGNKWDWRKGVSLKDILLKVHKKYGRKVIKIVDGINDTAKNYAIQNHIGTFAVISSVTNPFCDTCNRMRITADGKLKNCLFSSGEADLLSMLREGESIVPYIQQTIWRKKAVRGGMNTMQEFGTQNNRTMVAIGG